MVRQTRKYAIATQAVVDPESGRVTGWVYRWDNGEESQMVATGPPVGWTAPSKAAEHQASKDLQPLPTPVEGGQKL